MVFFNYISGCFTVFTMLQKCARMTPTMDYVLYCAQIILHNDPFNDKAPKEEDEHSCAIFGCCADVILVLWYKLLQADLIPEKGTMTHLL
jgi:hypothetical protein